MFKALVDAPLDLLHCVYNPIRKIHSPMIKKLYLTLYNAAQATLWSLALYKTLLPYVNAQFEFSAGPAAYVSGREMVEMAQSIAALEILHALLGITGGGPAAAIMQWAGRSNILFVALHFSRAAQTSPVAGLLFAAWALSEVIRYPWALLTTVKACPTWLTWLRYTAFIPLYPVGFVSEAFLLHTALPDLARQRVGIYPLPNPLNFSFDYPLLMKGLLYAYPVLSLYMFTYMLRQRSKKLSPTDIEKKRK